ncbi:MAG: 50S ribosomal protein L10 [Candidatus Omnitrophica bacterium]|nr:50S ribosomal protein L10 [Candidatus Omnitrophota bacterium]
MAKELKPGKFLKTRIIKEYEQAFKPASSYFVANFGGLTNKEIEDLKFKLKSVSAGYLVVKNSLCRTVFKALNIEALTEVIEGACAISYTDKDPVKATKILVDFSNANDKFKLRAGYLSGDILTPVMLKQLAAMPSREVLLARLVSAMNSPVVGLVTTCSAILKQFLYALNAVIKKKEENKEE